MVSTKDVRLEEDLEAGRGAPTHDPDKKCLCSGVGLMKHPIHQDWGDIYCDCRYGHSRRYE